MKELASTALPVTIIYIFFIKKLTSSLQSLYKIMQQYYVDYAVCHQSNKRKLLL